MQNPHHLLLFSIASVVSFSEYLMIFSYSFSISAFRVNEFVNRSGKVSFLRKENVFLLYLEECVCGVVWFSLDFRWDQREP